MRKMRLKSKDNTENTEKEAQKSQKPQNSIYKTQRKQGGKPGSLSV
jgi:hypothetical protein